MGIDNEWVYSVTAKCGGGGKEAWRALGTSTQVMQKRMCVALSVTSTCQRMESSGCCECAGVATIPTLWISSSHSQREQLHLTGQTRKQKWLSTGSLSDLKPGKRCLRQGLATVSCKGPDINMSRPHCLCSSYLILSLQYEGSHRQYVNKQEWLGLTIQKNKNTRRAGAGPQVMVC